MRYSRGGIAAAILACFAAGVSFAACVSGDDSVVKDSGNDTTTQPDVIQNNEGGSDVVVDVPIPPPAPDGSLVWLNHFNNNVSFTDTAFFDLAVNENGGLSYDVVGKFITDPAADNKYHFGTINLGPSTNMDFVSGGLSSTGSSVWATSATAAGGGAEHYDAAAVDSQGNLYVFGSTTGTSVTLKTTLPGPTSFVAKLTATGTPVWDHAYTQSGGVVSGPIKLALAGGNLVVGISFRTSITYDANTTFTADSGLGDRDVFMTAIDTSTGATKWTGSYGSSGGEDTISGMAATPQGDVVVTGIMGGTMTGLAGAGMPLTQVGDAGSVLDLYVMKIDATGQAPYGIVYGSSNGNVLSGPSIAYRNGTIAVAGAFSGTVDFGKGAFAATATDGFVMTIDETTKKTTFATQLAGAANDAFTAVALDPWSEIIAAGTYGSSNASAQLGAQALPQTSLQVGAMVLAKWDTSGTLLWAHGFVPTLNGGAPPYTTPDASNVPQSIVPTRVQTTSTGLIAITGTMTGGTDFGKGYSPEVSTLNYTHCTCVTAICISSCGLTSPPGCCNTPFAGGAADGIVGVWQP